jgi:long-chain acyl-CoA synthetase
MDTCYKIIKRNVERIPNQDFLGTRNGDKFDYITWKELDETCEALSYAIKAHSFTPEKEFDGQKWKFIGIQAKNRAEWQYVNLAGMYQNVCSIAFYDTLGTEATRYMCNQTELTTIAMALDQVDKFAKLKKYDTEQDLKKMQKVENLVIFEPESEVKDETKTLCADANLNLFYMNDLIAEGKALKAAGNQTIIEPTKEDFYMFSYTSGTTGDPKGVKVSHKMIIGMAYAVNARLKVGINETDSYLSYLPASHSFEQGMFTCSLIYGMKCGFFSGDVKKLMEDLATLRPTVFPSVPRLYNRIYGGIKTKLAEPTGIKGWLVKKALDTKMYYAKNGQGLTHRLYDRLVFNTVK